MSVQAITWAYEQYDLEPSLKLLLVTLANRTNHETGVCFPGQTLLAKECGMGERTVRRHLKTLEDRGYIERRPRMLPDGRGRNSDEYRLAYRHPSSRSEDQPANLAARSEDDAPRPTGQKASTNRPIRADQPANGGRVTGREPEENRKGARASSRKHRMPEGWRPSSEKLERMAGKYPSLDLEDELESFRLWTSAKAMTYADWDAAFENHCKSELKRNAPRLRTDHKGRQLDEQGRIVTAHGRFR